MGDQVKGRLALEHNVQSLKARISSKSSEISFKFSIQEKKIILQLINNQKFGTEMSPDQFLKKNLPRISPCLILCTLLSEPWVKWKTIWNNWTWPRYVCVIWCNNSVIDRLFRSRVTILISQLPDKQLITT